MIEARKAVGNADSDAYRADVADWRAMPVDVPPGYHGSSSAPPAPAPRLDAWSVVAFVCALVGAVPLTWAVPVLSVLAVPFGLAGRRNCQLDPTLRGRLLATAAVVIGVATVAAVGVLLATGHLSIGTGSG